MTKLDMESNPAQSHAQERVSAIPLSRRILLPLFLTANDAGRAAAEVLRLSAESPDDILLSLPLRGAISAALALSHVLRLPSTAPSVGMLFGAPGLVAPLLLQACSVRVLSRHAELALGLLDEEHRFSSLVLGGPAEQAARARCEVGDKLDALLLSQASIVAMVSERIGISQDELLALLSTRPEYSALEAAAAGWADAVI